MLLPPFPLVMSLELSAAILAAALVFTCAFVVRSRRRRAVRGIAALAVATLAAHAAWAVGLRCYPVSYWGAAIASAALPVGGLVVASMPVAWLARAVLARLLRACELPSAPASAPAHAVTRRAFVQGVSSAVPLAAASTGLAGFVADRSPTRVRDVRLAFPRLPADLAGLRILQLSDLHLGCTRDVGDLERLLTRLERDRPDLVLFTGDVAEDVAQLAPALRLAHDLRPRLGAYASLGNHEYLHDIATTRPIYDRSPVPLLVGAGTTLAVGRARLHLAGADDPVVTHTDIRGWMERAVERALDGAPADAFHLLLSHRPEGFEAAARRGVALTLSGHTHGGQIGFNGKSAFEPLYPDGYVWGAYARGDSRLYTTSGFGDWYPFRLGCPTEAPLVTLEAATWTSPPSSPPS